MNVVDRLLKADVKKAEELETGSFSSKRLAKILGEKEAVPVEIKEVPSRRLNDIVSYIGKFGKAIRNAGGFMKLLKSPSAIVVASLLAIVVAGVLVYKNWDKIKKAGGKMWSYIKKVFKDMGLSGKDVKEQLEPIGEKFQSIAKHAKKLWKISKPYLKKYGDMVKLVFGTYFGVAIGQAVGIIKAFFKSITGFVKGIMSIFDCSKFQ